MGVVGTVYCNCLKDVQDEKEVTKNKALQRTVNDNDGEFSFIEGDVMKLGRWTGGSGLVVKV